MSAVLTLAGLEELCASFELEAPVTMEDLAEIKRRVDERKACGVCSEVVLRGDRVDVVLGLRDAAVTVGISVSGAEPARSATLVAGLARVPQY